MTGTRREASKRQLKVAELIKKAVAAFFIQGKFYDPLLSNISITVSEVRVTPDLKTAVVFVVPLEKIIDSKDFIRLLKEHEVMIRREVTKSIVMKFSPKLVFKFDDSFDRVEKLEKIFEEIRSHSSSTDKQPLHED